MKHIYWVRANQLAGRPGPELAPWNPTELKSQKIGAVVSLCGPVSSEPLMNAGIEHMPLVQPMVLLESEAMRERFVSIMGKVLPFIDRIVQGGQAVMVHCYYGCDRSGAVLACSLVAREGLAAEEAIAQVRGANPSAMSAYGYAAAVETFERMYRDDASVFDAFARV